MGIDKELIDKLLANYEGPARGSGNSRNGSTAAKVTGAPLTWLYRYMLHYLPREAGRQELGIAIHASSSRVVAYD